MSLNVAVVQPLPGIGDMIWHLPHIRAIAAHVGTPVTLVTKPRSAADQIFSAEQTVRDVFWLDRNPEHRRGRHDGGLGLARVVAGLRARRFDAIYLLHHSRTLAGLAMLTGIPKRYGYGFGVQRLFLNRGPYLPGPSLRLHPFDQATAWVKAAGITLDEAEPVLPTDSVARESVLRRLGGTHGRVIAIGIGSSEPYKQWGAVRFAALADKLHEAGPHRLVLVGGPAERALAQEIQSLCSHDAARITPAIGWNLAEIAALFAMSDFYVGNDTGVMNMAAAVGIRTYCLFGGTPPFFHSRRIVPITPDGGVAKADGMGRITPNAVLLVIQTDEAARLPDSGRPLA